jgi:hypothetical protein
VVALERDLVEVLERPDLHRLELPHAEVLEDRGLRLLVHVPLAVPLLGDANLAAVERGDRLVDVHGNSPMIVAARSHSSSVGTSAKRT